MLFCWVLLNTHTRSSYSVKDTLKILKQKVRWRKTCHRKHMLLEMWATESDMNVNCLHECKKCSSLWVTIVHAGLRMTGRDCRGPILTLEITRLINHVTCGNFWSVPFNLRIEEWKKMCISLFSLAVVKSRLWRLLEFSSIFFLEKVKATTGSFSFFLSISITDSQTFLSWN